VEISKKSDSNFLKKSQIVEHRGDGDRVSKSLQNTLMRTQSIKNTIKSSVGSSEVKTVKQVSSASKSSPLNTLSNHSLTKKNIASKIKPESTVKSSDDSTIKKRKPREVGYSEKRGQSTIYMPRSITNKLNVKSNEKIAHRVSRDKEKSQDLPTSDQTKPRISSRERRKSRTLSPSEIRMLHSAVRRPDVIEKVEQRKNDITDSHSATQADVSIEDDYEDDFEVRKKEEVRKKFK